MAFLAAAGWPLSQIENGLPFSSPRYSLRGRIDYVYNEPWRVRHKPHVVFGIEGSSDRYVTMAVSSMDPSWPSKAVQVRTYVRQERTRAGQQAAFGLWIDGHQYESLEAAHASRLQSVYVGWIFALALLGLAGMCARGLYQGWLRRG